MYVVERLRSVVPLLIAAFALFLTLGCERLRTGVEGEEGANGQTAQQTAEEAEAAGTIVEVAAEHGDFDTFVDAVEAADLTATLEQEGPYTVFAPTDDAFADLPEGKLETLLKQENQKKLQNVLTYHVLSDQIYAEDVESGEVETVQGSKVNIEVTEDGDVTYGEGTVVETDVEASNGVIHAIDTVVMPPEAETAMK